MSESFIYCLEKVTDSEIEQKTEALIGLCKLPRKQYGLKV